MNDFPFGRQLHVEPSPLAPAGIRTKLHFCLRTDKHMVFILTAYDREGTESLIFGELGHPPSTVKANSWHTTPGRRALHRFRIPPTMPPPMNSTHAKTPRLAAAFARAVPESHIIILGNKNNKPMEIPVRKIEHCIPRFISLLWRFRLLGTSPSKHSKTLSVASRSCCCIVSYVLYISRLLWGFVAI